MRGVTISMLMVVIQTSISNAHAQQAAGNHDACVRDGRAKFTRLVGESTEHLRDNRHRNKGAITAYAGSKGPTAFALCIDWDKSTPDVRYGRGHGWYRGNGRLTQPAVDKVALRYCAEAKDAVARVCKCEIVHRNEIATISFPAGWPTDCK
jgi:hypothetical protein